MNFDLSFVYRVFDLPLLGENQEVVKVSTDSREEQTGNIFCALKGERFDGHDFVSTVLNEGALAVIVEHDFPLQDARLIRVDNTLTALGKLAHAWRMAINPKVLGITGSSGKTTVKEMLSCILKNHFGASHILSTGGNFNNEIGLPLTLFKLTREHQFAVLEMGMNHFGELARLTQIARPDVALVNNAQRVHIGCGFDGVSDIARAKSEIYQGLIEGGVGIYPADDAHAEVFSAAIGEKKKQSFGLNSKDVWASDVQMNSLGSEFIVHTEQEQAKIKLPVAGKHNIINALAAISLALQADVSLENCTRCLSLFKNIKGRLQENILKNGAKLIDDTYNANPDSMKAAIDVLAQFPAPRILVMGDLGELGDTAPQLHAEVGEYAKNSNIDYFFTLGELTQNACQEFGVTAKNYSDVNVLVNDLLPLVHKGVTVLVKGSRFMKMERVVEQLLEKA